MGYTVSRQQAKAFSSFVDPSALGIVFMAVAPDHQRQGVVISLLCPRQMVFGCTLNSDFELSGS